MLQFLPAIAGLLQNKQKQAEQNKQAEMAAYMGQAPGSSGGGDSKGGLLNGAMGLLQGIGGGEKPIQDVVAERYKGGGPASGPVQDDLSREAGMGSLSLPSMGVPWQHKEPDADDFGGPRDYDEDDRL